MAGIKSLAKDTAVYGISSIVGRFLNWCLVPLYTNVFSSGEYGVVTYLYAIVAMALIVLTYGMETGFFRFANHDRYKDAGEVYSTSLISLGCTSTLFFCRIDAVFEPCGPERWIVLRIRSMYGLWRWLWQSMHIPLSRLLICVFVTGPCVLPCLNW